MESCQEVAFLCRCREPAEHEMPHVCPCGAQWEGRLDEVGFRPVVYPPDVLQPGLMHDNPDW